MIVTMSKREEVDVVEQLLDAADGIAAMSRADLATLLRRAALDINVLRELVNIRKQLTNGDKAA
jgi:hypothetical protein